MHANEPSELPLVFQHHFNNGDVPGLLEHYYCPQATYSPVPGVTVTDDELRRAVERLVSLDAPIVVDVRHVIRSSEDTALVVLDWTIEGAGMRGTATDVGRLQADGTWKCVVDNPYGGVRLQDISVPPETQAVLAG